MHHCKKDAFKIQHLRSVDDTSSDLKTSQQIWDFVQSNENQLFTADDICAFIRKGTRLRDHQLCWNLFEFAKNKHIIDCNIYYHMIWILNHLHTVYSDKNETMQIYYELIKEMHHYQIVPNYRFITASFSLLIKHQKWIEIDNIWHNLKATANDLLHSTHCWNSYIDAKTKQCLLNNRESMPSLVTSLLDEMRNTFHVQTNGLIYGTVLSAIAKALKFSNETNRDFCNEMVRFGQALFDEYRAQNEQHDVWPTVYAAMIDLYGNIGDIEKCRQYLEIVVSMQSPSSSKTQNDAPHISICGEDANDMWKAQHLSAERTIRSCVGSTVKAIIRNKDISCEEGWKLVDDIYDHILKETCGLALNVVDYTQLFHCCAAFGKHNIDIKKLKRYYKQMITDGVQPNEYALHTFVKIVTMKYGDNKRKMERLTTWAIKECSKHQIPMNRVLADLNKITR